MSPRPVTLRQIAERADSLDEFGRHFRDWLHELRHFSSRDKVVAAVTDEPGRLVKKFAQGGVADAWLAAYAEFIAHRIRRPVPPWALKGRGFRPSLGLPPTSATLCSAPSPCEIPRPHLKTGIYLPPWLIYHSDYALAARPKP